jgi:hypothetical protein
MSEMSRAQGQAHQDSDPTEDMVPPAARSSKSPDAQNVGPRDSGAEDAGPPDVGAGDFGAEDVDLSDSDQQDQPLERPLRDMSDSADHQATGTQGSSDPMPDIAGTT